MTNHIWRGAVSRVVCVSLVASDQCSGLATSGSINQKREGVKGVFQKVIIKSKQVRKALKTWIKFRMKVVVPKSGQRIVGFGVLYGVKGRKKVGVGQWES